MCRLPASSILLLLSLASPSCPTSSPQAAMRHLHGSFAISLYGALIDGRPDGNLVVSPAGVAASLGLLQLGAKGATLAQLEGSLGYNVNDAQVRELLLQSQAETSNNSSRAAAWLRKTCVLLVQSGVKLVDGFTQNAAAWADASVVRGNFSQPGRGHVEAWPLQSGSSSGEMSGSGEAQQGAEAVAWWGHGLQMALVNTVAFRGVWQKQFHFSNTQNLPFILSDGTPVKVPMMYQTTEVSFGQFRTTSEQRYTVLELPYLGRSLSLQVVLPSERKTPLSSLEAQLSVRHMASWDVGLRRTKMDVFLPRFKVHNKFNLRSTLPVMGISDVFSPTAADFSGISAEESLYVSDAFHDVTIEVTEEGTKAAAATAMVLLKRSRAPVFKADRPFLFLLRHIQTGSILFMGRVTNPVDQSHTDI
ncbi:probable serpin E3 [Dunckerocampus dactyliophorus]|uniref:probable serpin E3 n=1 Tax=Dunckerocampus dactyliophorus TaxID=161453 RepID=UPI0024072AFA|nr:probable serpin E3 [Dunckerocampus dactyliophorus]